MGGVRSGPRPLPMPYLSVEDIERELGLTFGPHSHPTRAQVAEILEQVEAELDGFVAALGYGVPVRAPRPQAMLTQAALWAACARVLGAYAGATLEASPREQAYWERYRDFCDRLLAQPGILAGADRAPASGVQGEGKDPIFALEDRF
ncbi:MAG: hypothetical protein N2507_03290 [Candidatus Bipolaricaulota bacterium]|nr:hypothetical protein [Candidatus Bipolaricaulota bacterium]